MNSGADRRLNRANRSAARTLEVVRLLAAAAVLVTLVVGLSVALRGATQSLQSQMALATSNSQSR